MELCDHCGLGVGRWVHAAETASGDRSFCCYGCFVGWQVGQGGGDDSEATGFLIRLGVGAFLTMNIMLFSLLQYSGELNDLPAHIKIALNYLLWALATPTIIILGLPFYRETLSALRQKRLIPATLITVGTIAAYLYSAIATVGESDRVFFDTATMVLMLFTVGRYLEAQSRARAARSLQPMLQAQNQSVDVLEEGLTIRKKLYDVAVGMCISIQPGARIPVDGIVRSGVSQAEESTLTGEPHPIDKRPGSSVRAGSINGDQALEVEATVAGTQSEWIRICNDLRIALSQPTPLQQIAEKTAVAFIPLVLLLATFAVWLHWDSVNPARALMAGLAVLVVACPCALGLAAPLATSMAISRLLQRGVLLRNGAALETLSQTRTMALDKTGTLTTGRITCSQIFISDPALVEEQVLQLSAAVASASKHPLALSVVHAVSERNLDYEQAQDIQIVPGAGVTGELAGEEIYLGNARWFKQMGIPIVHSVVDAANAAAEQGQMSSFVAWQGVCRCMLVFDVVTHPASRAVVADIESQNIDVMVVTGDGKVQSETFCHEIGVSECHAELSPRDKKQKLAALVQRRGPVVMVGDGVNDALALTAADVGIAVGDATDIARESADVVLQPNQIASLLPLLSIAKITRKTIVVNLFWAFGYNGIALALAVSGSLQPIAAAALMAGSSLLVIANTSMQLKDDVEQTI